MIQSNFKILSRVRGAVAQIGRESDRQEHRNLVAAVDIALHELMLRCDLDYYCGYYQRGLNLALEGSHLLEDEYPNVAGRLSGLPQVLETTLSQGTIAERILEVSDCLIKIVQNLGGTKDEGGVDFLERVADWEGESFTRRSNTEFDDGKENAGPKVSKENLEAYLKSKFPDWRNLNVTDFEILSGGFSKLTVLFSCRDALNGEQSLVIRANQPIQNIKTDGSYVRNEFPVVDRMYKLGIPVAEPLWLETDNRHLGTEFFVSRKVAGEIIGSGHAGKAFKEITTEIKRNLIKTLLDIHKISIADDSEIVNSSFLAKWAQYKNAHDIAIATSQYWRDEADRHGAKITPRLQRIFDWLIANAPQSDCKPVLLHGDYGLHNILMKDDKVVAVLDWEIAKIGDPAEELIPLFMSLGVDHDDEVINLYEAYGGQRISRYRIYYYYIIIALRVLSFDVAADKNLSDHKEANMNLFLWAKTVYVMTDRINELITIAEAAKDNQY